MAKVVQGLERLISQFRDLSQKHRSTRLVVGYSASYAIYVHENLTARHRVGKAKYLEEPARMMARELTYLILNVIRAGAPLADACLAAGRRLLQVSQTYVPVDTGFLRQSGFVRVDA